MPANFQQKKNYFLKRTQQKAVLSFVCCVQKQNVKIINTILDTGNNVEHILQ